MSSDAVQSSGKCSPDDCVVDVSDNNTTNELQNSHGVSVSQVLRSFKASKAEDFIPQFVGLGPYHHFRSELVMSRKLKLGSAQRALHLGDAKLFLQECEKRLASESVIFGFYHADVDSKYDYQTLLSALTVDSLFLFGLLHRGTNPQGASFFLTAKHGMPLVNSSGVELTMDAIIRDVFMLENQIPTYFLKQIAQVNGNEIQSDLGSAMKSLCEEFCALVHHETLSKSPQEYDHLLHLMYNLTAGTRQVHRESESEPEPEPELESEPESDSEPEPMPVFMSELEALVFAGLVLLLSYIMIMEPESETQPQSENKDQEVQVTPKSESERQSEPLLQQVQVISESELGCESHPLLQQVQDNFELEYNPEPQSEEMDQQGNMNNQETQNVRNNWLISFKDRLKGFCRMIIVIVGYLMLLSLFLVYVFVFIGKLVPWAFRYLFHKVKQVLRFLCDKLRDLSLIIEPMLDLLSRYDAEIPSLRRYTSQVRHAKRIREEFMVHTTNLDEHAQPSATELHKAGIHFKPAEFGISSVKFDEERCRFYLPKIKLDVNSEVIIKNLVAYESLTKPKSLIFTRYLELMTSLTQTPEDVHLLVRKKIIRTKLSKQVVVQIFSGMSKSIGPTNTPKLEKLINKVNAKFESSLKLKRIMIKCSSGKWFAIIAGLALLILTAVQTVCSVVNCSRT